MRYILTIPTQGQYCLYYVKKFSDLGHSSLVFNGIIFGSLTHLKKKITPHIFQDCIKIILYHGRHYMHNILYSSFMKLLYFKH